MTCDEAALEPPSSALNVTADTCLEERKYWCFLLSSICTFLAGLTIVLVWRLFSFLCCSKEAEYGPNDPKQKEQKAARQGKQEFEGTFMTEAKDWAGELISGQTTTGRILREFLVINHNCSNTVKSAGRHELTKQSRRNGSVFYQINRRSNSTQLRYGFCRSSLL
ncbi:unnamed protein product [Brassicogethes aeneus]|uniref:Calcium-activated potassium channel slowpoke n=1 Tax=Brassicogethes aeneus TaxID=1431903 RepID=A0A9P0BC67_BRAAE|nr:unnamed protein product [Brassicogethes aeneus]